MFSWNRFKYVMYVVLKIKSFVETETVILYNHWSHEDLRSTNKLENE